MIYPIPVYYSHIFGCNEASLQIILIKCILFQVRQYLHTCALMIRSIYKNMALKNLSSLSKTDYYSFLESFDTVLTDCDGLYFLLKPLTVR